MNLDYLKTYLEVIRLGSFSEVAKKLSISQPAVSFQIQKLEQDLGVHLMDRSQKSITTTEAGKRLLRFAITVEKERTSLLHDIEQLREEVVGELTIAASTIPGEFLLPTILGEFKKLYPGIGAQVVISNSLNVINLVRSGDNDIGFCGVAPDSKELDCFKVAEDEIVLVVFPAHPFASRVEISFVELQGESLVFREASSGTQRSLENLLSRAGLDLKKFTPSMILGTTQAVVSAVEAKVGIAFVSSMAIKKSLALGLLKQVHVNSLRLRRDFYCIYRKERMVSKLLNEFIDFVRMRVKVDVDRA